MITWEEFEKIDLRVGTIRQVDDFPNARHPAYQIYVDFGPEIGIRKSSAQITALYSKEELIGKQVIAVINFPKKQIANFMSECLVTGFSDDQGRTVLAGVERAVPDGSRLM